MFKILAIDTSTDACSAALLFDEDRVIDRFMVAPKKHTSFILTMVDDLLELAGLSLKELDAIAFGCGPGSFTGLRLASSIVQGFAFAADLPVIKISTLRILAQQAFEEFGIKEIFIAEDARMQEVYWGEYSVNNEGIMRPINPDRLVNPRDLDIVSYFGFIGAGSGFEVYRDSFVHNNMRLLPIKYPQAKYMINLAKCDFEKRRVVSADKALPTYLRENVVRT